MAIFRDSTFLSCNGKTNIHVRSCIPDGAVRGIVQISHGVAEHVERYDDFAEYLAGSGYLVVANDHLGHGQSITDESDLGFFAEKDGWDLVVGDMRKLYELTHAQYPDVPYFLFGHSMGSFLTRTYIIKYPDGLAGAVISGTGQQARAIVANGVLLGQMECRRRGARYKSDMLNNLAFGSYNNGITPRRTDHDWLSRDNDVVDKYVADPLCGFVPSAGLFTDMMTGIQFIRDWKTMQQMNKDLPVFFISGDMDPVGESGKGVIRAYRGFLKAGMKNVTLKLYHECRHELLNELNRGEVMRDIRNWLNCWLPQAET